MNERPGPAGPTSATADSLRPMPAAGGAVTELDQARDGQAADARRAQAELELQAAIATEGFAGEGLAALAEYGYEFITPLLASGYIFTRCRKAGFWLLPLKIPLSDQEDLAQETVAEALRAFKDGLGQGGWQPEAGSLRTYFTVALLGQFANAWRRWLKDRMVNIGEQLVHRGLPLETLMPGLDSPERGPADVCVQLDEIRRGLVGIKHKKTRVALVLTEFGYSHEEIGELLGVTPRAVEGYLRRHRLRIAAVRQQGEQKP
jgi:DNA-directed RNA polymerase specialized sigma24 family protein